MYWCFWWVWCIIMCIIGQAKRAPHWGVQSRFCVIYIYVSVVCQLHRRNYVAHAHAQSHFWAVKTDLWHPCYWFRLRARAALAWRKRNVHLEMRNLKQTELQRLKNRGKKGWGLRIRRENEKIENHEKQRLATLKILKRGEVEEKPKTGEGGH